MGRKLGKSAIEVMRERFPDKASEIETYADAFDVLAEQIKTGGVAPLAVSVTLSQNESNKPVITFDKTAAEVFAAANAGRMVKITGTPTEDLTATMIMPIEVFKLETNGDISYTVKLRADADAADALYFGENFAGTDPVVLTEQ